MAFGALSFLEITFFFIQISLFFRQSAPQNRKASLHPASRNGFRRIDVRKSLFYPAVLHTIAEDRLLQRRKILHGGTRLKGDAIVGKSGIECLGLVFSISALPIIHRPLFQGKILMQYIPFPDSHHFPHTLADRTGPFPGIKGKPGPCQLIHTSAAAAAVHINPEILPQLLRLLFAFSGINGAAAEWAGTLS